VVQRKGYTNIRLLSEEVAEFTYRPILCERAYRIVVLRKNLVIDKGGREAADDIRYFFYITNEWQWSLADLVYFANDRCNQENLVEQLKNGVHALRLPVNTLEANGAYMVIAALAWSLKAWLALVQPRADNRRALLTMEFKRFLHELLLLPCQIIRGGHRLVYRLLQWNPWVAVILQTVETLRALRFT
jgi:hypothetical protein